MIFSYCIHVVATRHWAVWGICSGFSAVFIQSGGGWGVLSGEVVIQEEWGRALGMNHISSSSLTDSSAVKTEVFVLSHVHRDEMKWVEFNQFEMKLDTWGHYSDRMGQGMYNNDRYEEQLSVVWDQGFWGAEGRSEHPVRPQIHKKYCVKINAVELVNPKVSMGK